MLYLYSDNNHIKIEIMKTKTYKAGFTQWRADILNRLNMPFEVKNNQIIYRGHLEETLVSFLVDQHNK